MPVHDWTRVDASIDHDVHLCWIAALGAAINKLLPQENYALAELHKADSTERWEEGLSTFNVQRRRTLAIRHVSGHRLVAILEIVSPANKDRVSHVEDFAAKVVSALDAGVHVLIVDLFPPGSHDPFGMHGIIHQRMEQSEEEYKLPANEPLTLASYVAGPRVDVYLEHVRVGAALPEMPLFIRPDRYVNVPLESTYIAAYEGMPISWKKVIEGIDATSV